MRPFSIALEIADIERLKTKAKQLELPPHVYARSILLRALDVETNHKPFLNTEKSKTPPSQKA